MNKEKYYRNKKLLQLAKECPQCMNCGHSNNGNVVAAHSNQSIHGKGMGIKAHDIFIAYLCNYCHHILDNGNMNRQDNINIWNKAHNKTLLWLVQSGNLKT